MITEADTCRKYVLPKLYAARLGRQSAPIYQTVDFERAVALKARSEAIARNMTDFLKKTDRFAKTIVFCVDQEHAEQMRRALNNLNNDLAKQYPDYVCRITSEEGTVGRGYLSKFQELENYNAGDEGTRRKYYFDGGQVEIAAHLVYELDPDGKQLRVVKFSEYAAEKVRTLYPSAADLRKQWADPTMRAEIINKIVRERNRFRSIEVFE